jgi:S1-C subfamily serine protease
MKRIALSCPSCGTALASPTLLPVGKLVRCPRCAASFRISKEAAAAEQRPDDTPSQPSPPKLAVSAPSESSKRTSGADATDKIAAASPPVEDNPFSFSGAPMPDVSAPKEDPSTRKPTKTADRRWQILGIACVSAGAVLASVVTWALMKPNVPERKPEAPGRLAENTQKESTRETPANKPEPQIALADTVHKNPRQADDQLARGDRAPPAPCDTSKMHLLLDANFSKPPDSAIQKGYPSPWGFAEWDGEWATCGRIGDEWRYMGKKAGDWCRLPQAGAEYLCLSDFVFEADYRLAEGAAARSLRGWSLRFSPHAADLGAPRNDFHVLQDQVGIFSNFSNGWLMPLTPTPIMKAAPEPNTARLECFAGRLRVFINNRFMGEAFEKSFKPSGMVLVLKVADLLPTDVRFRRIRIWSSQAGPTSETPALARRMTRPGTFDDWLQDLEEAKQLAAKERKDILVLFDGTDWCGWSKKLARDVFLRSEFSKFVEDKFILVHLDFPENAPAKAKVSNAKRNQRISEAFHISGFPSIVLTDAQGLPYAFETYESGGIDSYCTLLMKRQEVRVQRDALFKSAGRLNSDTEIEAARNAVALLEVQDRRVLIQYVSLLDTWAELADGRDPRNQRGEAEFFFEKAWTYRLIGTNSENGSELASIVKKLDAWNKNNRFIDKDRAARMHLLAGLAMSYGNKSEQSAKYFKAGLGFAPADEKLRERLSLAASGKAIFASGTGFVVASGGYILTNHHVIKGPGRTRVLLSQGSESLPAKVLFSDERKDIALLKVEAPNVRIPPLRLATKRPVDLAQEVGIVGYPAPEGKIKFNKGAVSGIAENGNGGILALDLRVNPGNSGGPLFDSSGNVVGMVFAKRRTTQEIDSEGYALSALELDAFLQKHCTRYGRQTTATRKIDWEEIVRKVRPGVVRVLKVL